MKLKLLFLFALLQAISIPSLGQLEYIQQYFTIDLQESESTSINFNKEIKMKINLKNAQNYDNLYIQISSLLQEYCSFTEPAIFFYSLGGQNQVFLMDNHPFQTPLILISSQNCDVKITAFKFIKVHNNENILASLPISTIIGDTETGYLQTKNHVIRYSFSSIQSNPKNIITITIFFNKKQFIPEIKICKHNSQCYKPDNPISLEGIFYAFEIEEAYGEFEISIGRKDKLNQSKSFFMQSQESMSIYQLRLSKQNFFLGRNQMLHIKDFQRHDDDEIIMYKISKCKGKLKIIPQNNSENNLRMLGRNIWSYENLNKLNSVFETQQQYSLFRIRYLLNESHKKAFKAINSSLEFSVKSIDGGDKVVQIFPITFDTVKLTDWEKYKVQFKISIYKFQYQVNLDEECIEIDYSFPNPKPLFQKTLKQQGSNIIEYQINNQPGDFIKVQAQIENEPFVWSESIVLKQKSEWQL